MPCCLCCMTSPLCCVCRQIAPPYDMEDLLYARIDGNIHLDRVNSAVRKHKYKILPTAFAKGEERNCFLAMDINAPGHPLQVSDSRQDVQLSELKYDRRS